MKLKNIDLNAEIQFGKMIWIIKAKKGDIVTLALKDSIRNMEFDAKESENPDEDVRDYGNNNYILSNVRQWLNVDGKDWFKKTHKHDAPPSYAGKEGFMSNFRKKELKRITPKRVPGNDNAGDLFYLPAEEEKDLVTGEQFDRNWVWVSTPYSGGSCSARIVNSAGTLSSYNAYLGGIGVRPLCDLISGTKVEAKNGIWTVACKKQTKQANKIPKLLKLLGIKADEPFRLKTGDTIICNTTGTPFIYTICENGRMFRQKGNDSCVDDCDLIVPILRGDYVVVKSLETIE